MPGLRCGVDCVGRPDPSRDLLFFVCCSILMAMRKARLVGLKPGRSMPFLSRQGSAIGGSRIKAVAAAEIGALTPRLGARPSCYRIVPSENLD